MRHVCTAFVLALAAGTPAVAADAFMVDPVHSAVSFKIQHMGISQVHGRFNKFEGALAVDKADAGKSMFSMKINADSVDTGNEARDKHLRNPDFFDTKQYAEMTFKSTAVKAVKDGFEVEGDFAMHGKTKKIKFTLQGGKEVEVQGAKKIGFITDFIIKRSDFGMVDKNPGGLSDEVYVSIGLEGTRK